MTNGGIGTALAIKTADPTAEVSGPVIDFWWGYFYSMKDVRSGWNTGAPCYLPWCTGPMLKLKSATSSISMLPGTLANGTGK